MRFGTTMKKLKKQSATTKMINEDASNYEGSIIMQAIVSHSLIWKANGGDAEGDGSFQFDPNTSVKTKLQQVDVYPDLSYDDGYAKSTYVVYTNLPDLHEVIKSFDRWLSNFVSTELMDGEEMVSPGELKYSVSINTNDIVLRGLTQGDNKNPSITFKASTDFVSKFENDEIDNWNNVRVQVKGDFGKLDLTTQSKPGIKDVIDENGNMIIEQILPSLILSFRAEQMVDSQADK